MQQTDYRHLIGAWGLGGPDRVVSAHEEIRRKGEPGEAAMSWKVEVIVDDSGEWEGDPLRFATEHEALAYARDLEFRCSAIRDKRIAMSGDAVNESWPRCRAGAVVKNASG